MANSKVISNQQPVIRVINYSELKKGTRIVLKDEPYEIIECAPLFKGRGQSVLRAKIKNLKTGNVLSWTFRPSDSFEEPDLSKVELKYLFCHRNRYVFCQKDNPSERFELTKEQVGDVLRFLKQNQVVEGVIFEKKLTAVSLPIKVTLKVASTPPGVKGERAQSGTKTATLETGTKISVPLFIRTGDEIEINTRTGEYVRRIEG